MNWVKTSGEAAGMGRYNSRLPHGGNENQRLAAVPGRNRLMLVIGAVLVVVAFFLTAVVAGAGVFR